MTSDTCGVEVNRSGTPPGCITFCIRQPGVSLADSLNPRLLSGTPTAFWRISLLTSAATRIWKLPQWLRVLLRGVSKPPGEI